uniref:hypothetical protein n=2 Tax=uncultured Ligilactobacillus sp. TaxID=2837633 RepID=UPI00272CD65C
QSLSQAHAWRSEFLSDMQLMSKEAISMLANGVWNALNILGVSGLLVAILIRMSQGYFINALVLVGLLVAYLVSVCMTKLYEIVDLLRMRK